MQDSNRALQLKSKQKYDMKVNALDGIPKKRLAGIDCLGVTRNYWNGPGTKWWSPDSTAQQSIRHGDRHIGKVVHFKTENIDSLRN